MHSHDLISATERLWPNLERKEPRCRICRDEPVHLLVNELLDWHGAPIFLGRGKTHVVTYADILRDLEPTALLLRQEGDRDYQHIRGVNDVMVLMSCEDPMHWDMHGYQLGGTGRELPADDRLRTDFGAPMTPQEWDATIRKAAAAGRAVYAIPVKDDVVGRNVCLHFPTTPDREDTAP